MRSWQAMEENADAPDALRNQPLVRLKVDHWFDPWSSLTTSLTTSLTRCGTSPWSASRPVYPSCVCVCVCACVCARVCLRICVYYMAVESLFRLPLSPYLALVSKGERLYYTVSSIIYRFSTRITHAAQTTYVITYIIISYLTYNTQ